MTDKLKIEYMPIEDIRRAPRNPKDHDLGALHGSLKRFEFVSPLIINEGTGRLVVGHGRLDVLQQLKATGKKPPGRVVKKGESWLVPVVRGVEFASDEDAEAYLLADNHLGELGGWDEELLVQVLSDLAASGEEMLSGTGYDPDDIDKMLANIQGSSDAVSGNDNNNLIACPECGHEFVLGQKEGG